MRARASTRELEASGPHVVAALLASASVRPTLPISGSLYVQRRNVIVVDRAELLAGDPLGERDAFG